MTAPQTEMDGGLYAARQKIYPREIEGRFQRMRTIAAWVLLGIYYVSRGSRGASARRCCSTCPRASSTSSR